MKPFNNLGMTHYVLVPGEDIGSDHVEFEAVGLPIFPFLQDQSVYDIFGPAKDLKKFVAERDPKRIAVNMSEYIGAAELITFSCKVALFPRTESQSQKAQLLWMR